jgi:nucleoid DNA-binding protein/LysM repeat protein
MNDKLHIAEIAELLAAAQNISRRDAEAFVRELFTMINEVLEQERYVKIKGFGTFKLIEVDTRESVSISTGERIEIHGYTKISFTPDTALKELINKPFSHFENVIINDDVILPDEPDAEPEPAQTFDTPASPATPAAPIEKEPFTLPPGVKTEPPVVTAEPSVPEAEAEPELPADEAEFPAYEPSASEQELLDTPLSGSHKRSTLRYFAGMVAFVIVIFGIGLLYMSHLHWFDSDDEIPPPARTTRPTPPPFTVAATDTLASSTDTITAAADTLPTETPKTMPSTPAVTAPTATASPTTAPTASSTPAATTPMPLSEQVEAAIKKEKQQPSAFAPDSTGYNIVGTLTTHTIRSGETLTRIALRYYGTKSLYPYIISYNARVIKNPNSVPLGTVLQIPELEKKK